MEYDKNLEKGLSFLKNSDGSKNVGKSSGFFNSGTGFFSRGNGFKSNKKPRKKLGGARFFGKYFTVFVMFLFFVVMAFSGGFFGGWFSRYLEKNRDSQLNKPSINPPENETLMSKLSNDSDFAAVVERVTPAIVGICAPSFDYSKSAIARGRFKSRFPFFGNFFDDDFDGGRSGSNQNVMSIVSGSGFFVKDNKKGDHYIITNYHVIKDYVENVLNGSVKTNSKFDRLSIILKNNISDPKKAEVVGYDSDCDIAVLKIPNFDHSRVSYLKFANSDSIKVGEKVLVIGSPLSLKYCTVTGGIVSARRKIEHDIGNGVHPIDVIQTDAAINSGNSGGPVVNVRGEVIGVTTGKYINKGSDDRIDGCGIAIDVKLVEKVFDDVVNKGLKNEGSKYPHLGIMSADRDSMFSSSIDGVVIEAFTEDSAAQAAGMKIGDLIVSIDGQEVSCLSDLIKIVRSKKIGEEVSVVVWRRGADGPLKFNVKLSAAKPEPKKPESNKRIKIQYPE